MPGRNIFSALEEEEDESVSTPQDRSTAVTADSPSTHGSSRASKPAPASGTLTLAHLSATLLSGEDALRGSFARNAGEDVQLEFAINARDTFASLWQAAKALQQGNEVNMFTTKVAALTGK